MTHAAQAQSAATVIGWVAGTPIPRERLDARIRQLRAARLAGRLPVPGSKEDRQFLRWAAQVLLTEELCRVELAQLAVESKLEATPRAAPVSGGDVGGAEPRTLTQAESLHLGSINAAAWSNSAEMSALYDLVTAPTSPTAPADVAPTRTWYRVTHAVGASPLEAATIAERLLGWTTLDDLPAHLAADLRAVPVGTRVGPVRSGLGWHFATVVGTEVRAAQPVVPSARTTDPGRLAAFNRWLDLRRRALVTHAPGFEHPGDPAQPDNTHRH